MNNTNIINFDSIKTKSIDLILFLLTMFVVIWGFYGYIWTAINVAIVQVITVYYLSKYRHRDSNLYQRGTIIKSSSIFIISLLTLVTLTQFSIIDNYTLTVLLSLTFNIINIIFILFILSSRVIDSKTIRLVYMTIPISIVIIGLVILLVGLYNFPLPLSEYNNDSRVPLNNNRNILSFLCTASCCVCLHYLMNPTQRNGNKYIYYSISTINFTLLIWLGSRGAIISLSGTLLLYICYLIHSKELILNRLLSLFVIISLSTIISSQLSLFDWNGPGRYFSSVSENTLDNKFNLDSSMRIVIWSQCIEAIKESPFFGYGPEGYQFHPDNSYGIQPHNVIFQFLMSYGFIGTSIILSLYLIVMSSGINKIINKKNKSYDIINIDNLRVSLLIIVGFSIFGLVDGTFYHAQSLYIICIAFSVLISNYINTNSENCIYNPR